MDSVDAPRDAERPQVGPADGPSAGTAVLRVLVCDDSVDDRALLRVNLELEGWRVTEAIDGDAVLQLLHEADDLPDAITLDAVMPHCDGWHTTAQIRGEPAFAEIPIIMVTASSQGDDRARAEAAGVDAFVAKPFDPTEIVELVRRLVGRARGRAGFTGVLDFLG